MSLFAWMHAAASGYEIDPSWPWLVLAVYGPVCVLMLCWVLWDWHRGNASRWDVLWGVGSLALVAAPAVGRLLDLL